MQFTEVFQVRFGIISKNEFLFTSNETRRPLSTGMFSAKNVTHQHGFEPGT